MSDSLPEASRRVAAAADALGLAIDIRLMPDSTRTAQDAASACGCSVGQIVKSLVFTGAQSGRDVLLLVSGDNRVDEAGVAAHLGEALERPRGAHVRKVTGFAIGGIPPFGHESPLAAYIDEDLLRHDVVWAAAGTPNAVFSVDPKALQLATGAQVISVRG
ncbi:MAG: YbaK/EbsC family protein [Salinarimonas sp.]|nr:YbaK/EbsC family protein [Salinarimonas sp.]